MFEQGLHETPRTVIAVTIPSPMSLNALMNALEFDVVVYWLDAQGRKEDVVHAMALQDVSAFEDEARKAGMSVCIVNPLDEVHVDYVPQESDKLRVSRDDLVEYASLFKMAAGLLNLSGDEFASVECGQAAEMIEEFYLPYDSNGVRIESEKKES